MIQIDQFTLMGRFLEQIRSFDWDASVARFRSPETGRFISETAILRDLERFNEGVLPKALQEITDGLMDGRLTLGQWQERIAREIKEAYVINLQVGRGGAAQTRRMDYGRIGGRIKFEYARLNQFAVEIKGGQLSEAQIRARTMQYTAGPRTAFFDGQTAAKIDSGKFVQEQRFLGDADHCSVCVGFAAMGRVPIGALPEPGTNCLGRHNCKCIKQYFRRNE